MIYRLLTSMRRFETERIFLALVYIRSLQRLARVHTMENLGKKTRKSKLTWYNKSKTFATNKKVEMIGLKMPQFTKSR